MTNPMIALFMMLLNLYWWVVVISLIIRWLIAFNVMNPYHHSVRSLRSAMDALTEPALRQVRRIIPPIGRLDVAPLIVLLAIFLVQYAMLRVQAHHRI